MPALDRSPHHHRPFMLIGLLFVLEALALLLYLLPPLAPGMALTSLGFIGVSLLCTSWLLLRNNTRLRQAASRPGVLSETDKPAAESELAIERATATDGTAEKAVPAVAGCAAAHIVLITRNDTLRQTIVTYLKTWGRNCHVVESCVEATCYLLNQVEQAETAQPSLLIVDTQGLELEATRFASLVRNEARLSQIRLLCLKSKQYAASAQQLLQAGYAELIDTPIEKSQLFTAVEGGKQIPHQADNVIDINRRREVRYKRGARKHILLAEPNPQERARLLQQLDRAGHRVTGVENGEQALDALELQHFDLAVINLAADHEWHASDQTSSIHHAAPALGDLYHPHRSEYPGYPEALSRAADQGLSLQAGTRR